MTSALIVAAVLSLVVGLIALAVWLSRKRGVLETKKDAAAEADAARKVRDEVEMETRHLTDTELLERLSKWTRKD